MFITGNEINSIYTFFTKQFTGIALNYTFCLENLLQRILIMLHSFKHNNIVRCVLCALNHAF